VIRVTPPYIIIGVHGYTTIIVVGRIPDIASEHEQPLSLSLTVNTLENDEENIELGNSSVYVAKRLQRRSLVLPLTSIEGGTFSLFSFDCFSPNRDDDFFRTRSGAVGETKGRMSTRIFLTGVDEACFIVDEIVGRAANGGVIGELGGMGKEAVDASFAGFLRTGNIDFFAGEGPDFCILLSLFTIVISASSEELVTPSSPV